MLPHGGICVAAIVVGHGLKLCPRVARFDYTGAALDLLLKRNLVLTVTQLDILRCCSLRQTWRRQRDRQQHRKTDITETKYRWVHDVVPCCEQNSTQRREGHQIVPSLSFQPIVGRS